MRPRRLPCLRHSGVADHPAHVWPAAPSHAVVGHGPGVGLRMWRVGVGSPRFWGTVLRCGPGVRSPADRYRGCASPRRHADLSPHGCGHHGHSPHRPPGPDGGSCPRPAGQPQQAAAARPTVQTELRVLSRRARWISRAIALSITCALKLCLTVTTLFVGALLRLQLATVLVLRCVPAMLSLSGAVLTFFRKILLATHPRRLGPRSAPPRSA